MVVDGYEVPIDIVKFAASTNNTIRDNSKKVEKILIKWNLAELADNYTYSIEAKIIATLMYNTDLSVNLTNVLKDLFNESCPLDECESLASELQREIINWR